MLLLDLGPDFGVRHSLVIYIFRYLLWAGPLTYYLLFMIAPGLWTLYESHFEALKCQIWVNICGVYLYNSSQVFFQNSKYFWKKDLNSSGIKACMRLNHRGPQWRTSKPIKTNNFPQLTLLPWFSIEKGLAS